MPQCCSRELELDILLLCEFFCEERGLVSKETVVLRRWGSDTRKFGLSTELIM